MKNHRTVLEIVRVGCKRVRALVNDPQCWDPKEILAAVDHMEAQAAEELVRQYQGNAEKDAQ